VAHAGRRPGVLVDPFEGESGTCRNCEGAIRRKGVCRAGPQRTDIDIGCARIRAGTAQCQRPGATLCEATNTADRTAQCRAVAISIERTAAGTKRRATVRGEACEKLERTAAECESTAGSPQVGVGGNGERSGVDRRAPGVRIDAAKDRKSGA